MRNIIIPIVAGCVLFLNPWVASALEIKKVSGDGQCGAGYQLLSAELAETNKTVNKQACDAIGQWDIVRLAGGGSISGKGYQCKVFRTDTRTLGASLCEKTPKELNLTNNAIQKDSYVIDVLLLPTQSAAQKIPEFYNGRTVEEQKTILVDYVNTVLKNSKLNNIQIRLIKSTETTINYSSEDAALKLLTESKLRDQYGADLVIGLSHAAGGGKAAAPCNGKVDPNRSFVAVVPAGSTYSFAHEIGHILGAGHLKSNSHADSCSNADYAHAYAADGYRTVVSTPGVNEANGTKSAGMYSNPDAEFQNGKPAGTKEANNARIIRELAPKVAAYR